MEIAQEKERIVEFIKQSFAKQGIQKAVIGLSGGVDSATALVLLAEAIGPENIYPVYIPYYYPEIVPDSITELLQVANITRELSVIEIAAHVQSLEEHLDMSGKKERLGNVMARLRMIVLFDAAKANKAMVCGTENRSERFLGYYTRFGDGASDIEPIHHLYKTEVYHLARYLKVPELIIQAQPTAGLWEGQTDEGQFGFTYHAADEVIKAMIDRREQIQDILEVYPSAGPVIDRINDNYWKEEVPYSLERV